MLPSVVPESSLEPFKFWFNDCLQDGVHFRNELYYRLRQNSPDSRGQLYQVACRLAQRGADVLLTVSEEDCSLWTNLRNQKVAASGLSNKLDLPSLDTLLQQP